MPVRAGPLPFYKRLENREEKETLSYPGISSTQTHDCVSARR